MGIMKRFTRICKADINGVMDQIEDKDLILKQCLREMEEAISKKQARANNIRASIEKIVYQKDRFFYDQKKLEKDISSAIEKDKDDMARMLIKKIKTMDQHIDALDQHKTDLEKKIAALNESIEDNKLRYAQYQLQAEAYFQQTEHRQWQKTVFQIMPQTFCPAISEQEVEFDLMMRKEAMKGGDQNGHRE